MCKVYEQVQPSTILALHHVTSWKSPACHCHLVSFSWATLAVLMVPVGQHRLDGANIVYTGVGNTYANTDTNMHATAMIGVSMLLVSICDRVHGIWGGVVVS